MHRYKSWRNIPTWANEGLAEVLGAELVPNKSRQISRRTAATSSLSTQGVGPGFFTATFIDGWQYPVAENLCSYMISANRKGYVAFINAIKEGVTPEKALQTVYGATEERLVEAYKQSMGVKR